MLHVKKSLVPGWYYYFLCLDLAMSMARSHLNSTTFFPYNLIIPKKRDYFDGDTHAQIIELIDTLFYLVFNFFHFLFLTNTRLIFEWL